MKRSLLLLSIFLISILLAACAPQVSSTPQAVAEYSAEQPAAPAAERVKPEVLEQPEAVEQPAMEEPAPPRPIAVEPRPTLSPPEPEREPAPHDNTFRDYGVNPFVDTYEDHLSTFALDVDTASYTVARRYVMDGNLPPADAVRVEEFVNYFDPGYASPPETGFAIYADGAPSPFHGSDTYLLRFGIQGYHVAEWARRPAVLTFVIDVSGSMQREDRLELVKNSLRLLVERLDEDDRLAIVVYGTTAHTVLEPTGGEHKRAILRAIERLRPEGSTNAEAGLVMGYALAMRAYRPDAINRLILCSDEVANVGATGPDEILRQVHGYVEEGITLTTVGFGMGNFNDVLMEQLADNGDGFYAYVDTLDEARKIFVEDLTSTLQMIAKDAKVQVDFNPEVVAYYRLLGYENRDVADQDFRNDAVDAGELGAGHSATAIYAVQFEPGAEGRIATIQLRWQDPDTYAVREINGNFNTWDLAGHFEDTDPHYRLAVLAAQYAELLRNSPWAGGTTFERLAGYAEALPSELYTEGEVAEFVQLLRRAARIAW